MTAAIDNHTEPPLLPTKVYDLAFAAKGIENPWDYVLPKVLAVHKDLLLKQLPYDAYLSLYGEWFISYHWVIKLGWKAGHHIPFPRGIANIFKPRGVVLHSLRMLCNFWFAESKLGTFPFAHSAYLFAEVFGEKLVNETLGTASQFQGESFTKEQLLRPRRDEYRKLKAFENPVDANLMPKTHLLYEAAIKMAETSKGAKPGDGSRYVYWSTYWKPFLDALKGEIAMLESFTRMTGCGGSQQVFMQMTAGKGLVPLNLSRSGSRISPLRKGFRS